MRLWTSWWRIFTPPCRLRRAEKVFYPGEIEIGTRKDNQKNGIPVIEEVWEQIKAF